MANIKRALVIGGGSIKGAFEAGAIKVILDSGFVPDAIYGVSVGALNGGYLANFMGANPGKSWPEAGDELLDFWKTKVTSFKVLGKERKKLKVYWKIAFGGFKGFLNMNALRDLIHKEVKASNIAKSKGAFFPGVVDLETGTFFYGNAKTDPDDFVDYIIASTREPILMELMHLDNKTLIDGGVRNISPLKSAIDAGANEIITIATQPEEVTPEVGKDYESLMTLAGRTIGIMTNEIVNNDLNLASKINLACIHYGKKTNQFKITAGPLKGYKYVESTIIRPDQALAVDITNFTPADIQMMIDRGTQRANEALKARNAFRTKIGFKP
ncbi:MAG: patatin-like phospholipase family protein [Sphingomonadales bacterium]